MGGFTSAMRENARELRLRGRVDFLTGTSVELQAEDFVSVRISEGVDSGVVPGAVISAECLLIMDDSMGQWQPGGTLRGAGDPVGARFTVEIGVLSDGQWLYAPMGVYFCEEMRRDVNSPVVEIKCHDSIWFTTSGEFEDTLSYPCSLKAVLMAAMSQAGYDYQGPLPDDSMIIDKKPAWNGATVRSVIGYCAAAMGCCVLIDRWGFPDLKPLAGEQTALIIHPAQYMELSVDQSSFGPVNRLEVTTVNAAGDADGEAQQVVCSRDTDGAQCTLEVSANPLYITGGSHLNALAGKTLAAVSGLKYVGASFVWRGDPDIAPGRLVKITGVDGDDITCMVSRQTMTFDGGFVSECISGVPGASGASAVSWNGGIKAGSIVGVLSPGAIGAESITAAKLAAGSVTSDKITAGAVTAGKIAAKAVTAENIDAGAVKADAIDAGAVVAEKLAAGAVTVEKIDAGAVTADKIAAGAVDTASIAAGAVTAEKIAARTVTAEHIAAKTITADSGVIDNGAIGTAQIADGSITAAKVVSLNADVINAGTLSAERLLLVGENGIIYKLNAEAAGLSVTELQKEEYQNHINGTVIVARSITAAQIAAETITGNEILAGSITAKEINVSDLFASQATIDALNAMDISSNKYLKLMVSDAVGGKNYLLNSGVKVSNANYAIAEYRFGSLVPVEGETYTLRIWGSLGSDREYFHAYNSSGTIALVSLADNGDGTYSGTFTWRNTGGSTTVTPTFLRIYQRQSSGTTASTIERIKLEQGEHATDWSPNPEEFSAGSSILMNKDEVNIRTPKFNVNIVSEDGEANMLSIDEEGANMQKLTAGNVAVRYDGPSQLYVNPSATAAQIEAGNYFRSLADALSMLNQKHVDRYVDIRLAAGMTEYGSLTMAAISGGQWISIIGDSASPAKLVGGLTISYCISPISIKYLNVDTQSIGIGVAGCSWVTIDSCVITGPGTGITGSRCVYAYNGGVVSVSNCELYDCQYSMQGDRAGSVTGSANKGNCRVGANRCCVHLENSQPCDSTTWTVTEWAGKVYTASVSVNQGSKTTPVPAPTSASVTANLTDSWYSSSKAWINSDNYMRQGYTGNNGEWSGCMWFATSAFSGKTIKSAALTIKRDNGYGRSGEVTLKLWGITATTNSGNPNTSAVSYGALGTIENGETKTFTLPIAAAQALANGTIKGFMLRSDDGGVMSGRTYSYNYCRISTKPVLAVTFTT